MTSRIIVVLAVAFVAVFGGAADAEAQYTRGERCREPGRAWHVYRLTMPDNSLLSIRLYFNNDDAGFLIAATLDDLPRVASAAFGRFVSADVQVMTGGEMEIRVACVRRAADYRLSVKTGGDFRYIGPPARTERYFDPDSFMHGLLFR